MTNETVVFTLTRGYALCKWKFYTLIRRNWALRNFFFNNSQEVDYLIFHEGNITKFDQKIISKISRIEIQFVNVSEHFKKNNSDVWTGKSKSALGYSFMCKFYYSKVWFYLKEYKIAIRVDEDCLIENLPEISEKSIFECGAIHPETHTITNQTLPELLKEMNQDQYYDHKFPYTNVFITKPRFWLREDVQAYLKKIASHPYSLENRWGDLPVVGVALKSFSSWNAKDGVNGKIVYQHLSHRATVRDKKIFLS
jgi:hypothetical protein